MNISIISIHPNMNGGGRKITNSYLFNTTRGEIGGENVTNASPLIVLSNRHYVVQVPVQTKVLKGAK